MRTELRTGPWITRLMHQPLSIINILVQHDEYNRHAFIGIGQNANQLLRWIGQGALAASLTIRAPRCTQHFCCANLVKGAAAKYGPAHVCGEVFRVAGLHGLAHHQARLKGVFDAHVCAERFLLWRVQ